MAESVDASVSNTDRETCAGSTPARSTKQALHNQKIVERFFCCVGAGTQFVPFVQFSLLVVSVLFSRCESAKGRRPPHQSVCGRFRFVGVVPCRILQQMPGGLQDFDAGKMASEDVVGVLFALFR